MMMRFRDRGFCRGVTLALALLLALWPSQDVLARADRAAVAGALTIATSPDGAGVYVDDKYAGQSPVDVKGLLAGQHKVRIVKSGYLENVRVVKMAEGQPTALQVSLTRHAGTSAVAPGGSKKWLWIGLAGAGAAGAIYYVATKNSPPTISGPVSVSPTGTGMAGQTSFTLGVSASDPDGDSLTYTWDFGDGTSGSGAAPTKVYTAAGTYSVRVTVSDGKKSVSGTGSVTVGPNMTAVWTGGRELEFGCSVNWNLTQNGTALTGSMTFSGGCSGTLTGVTGTVNPLTHPAAVSVTSPSYNFTVGSSVFPGLVMSFSGTTATTGTTMAGNLRLRQAVSGYDRTFAATYSRQ